MVSMPSFREFVAGRPFLIYKNSNQHYIIVCLPMSLKSCTWVLLGLDIYPTARLPHVTLTKTRLGLAKALKHGIHDSTVDSQSYLSQAQ